MLGTTIARRILGSFLLLTLTALLVLGLVLTSYFQSAALKDAQTDLVTHARIIALALEHDARSPGGLDEPIAEISAQTGLRITVLDDEGRVLADSDRDAQAMENHWERPEIQQALAKGLGTATRYSATVGANMLYVAIPWRENGRLVGIIRTATSLAPIDATVQQTVTVLAAALFLAFFASVVLAIYLARRQLQPILTIIRAARAIMRGDLARRILLHTGDEFDILIRALNELAASLAQRIVEARTENEKLNLILETMDNGVVLFDADGNITDANRRIRELFGLHESDMRRHSIHVLGSAVLSETAQDVLASGAPKKLHLTLPIHGEPHTFTVYFATFVARHGTAVLAVFHDISVLEELRARQAAFVGNAAHELKTPLTSIRGFSELLAGDDFSDPEASRHCAAVIEKEAERMDRLVASRLDRADLRKNIERMPIAVSRALASACDELVPRAQKKQQHVDVHIETSAKLLANADLFGQILRNLIDNAIKYTPAGGTIRLACAENDGQIEITVADNGIGIPQDALPRIFDRFYRVDKARDRATGGNGIGLSLVQFLVKLFDGTIEAQSEVGKGTRFLLRFPKVEGEQAADFGQSMDLIRSVAERDNNRSLSPWGEVPSECEAERVAKVGRNSMHDGFGEGWQ